jgi:hypothetical protein
MEAQYVNIAFLLVLNTGAIPDACRDWQRCAPVNQTWADFRREFYRAQREQRIISSTASGAGYQTENIAEHYEHYEPTPIPGNSSFVTVMANLTTATSADRETVATLTKAIATLTASLHRAASWGKLRKSMERWHLPQDFWKTIEKGVNQYT